MLVRKLMTDLLRFWRREGCDIIIPYDMEKGAATAHPKTFFGALSNKNEAFGYMEQCRRPQDGRYGESPNRLYKHHQMQVFFKPAPEDIKERYMRSLEYIGLNLEEHDIKFLEDNWEQPTLGAWGLGSEVRLDGTEITQFTYFQQVGKVDLKPVPVEIAYGLERIAMYIQKVDSVFDLMWDEGVEYTKFLEPEYQYSKHGFEVAKASNFKQMMELYMDEAKGSIKAGLYLVAYDYILKMTHAFNILDATQQISAQERQSYILEISKLSKATAEIYVKGQEISKEKEKSK